MLSETLSVELEKETLENLAPVAAGETTPEPIAEEPAILEELQIEEVDIDGMCGVY